MILLFSAIILITGILIYTLVHRHPFKDSRKLAKKFGSIGNMTGMHVNNLIQRTGPPFSKSQIGNDVLVQWMQTGYHISILFDENGIFKRVTHESLVD